MAIGSKVRSTQYTYQVKPVRLLTPQPYLDTKSRREDTTMIPPGWNVTEPIELACKLVKVVEALSSASQDARAFVSKIDNFRRSLSQLQKKLDDAALGKADDYDHLRATLAECKVCVERCEDFSKDFAKLNNGSGSGRFTVAGQATRWVWQDGKASKLRREIDSQMNDISFLLLIKSFGDAHRMGGHEPPITTEACIELDASNANRPELGHNMQNVQRQRMTPAHLLGLDNTITRSSFVKTTPTGESPSHCVPWSAEPDIETPKHFPPLQPTNTQSTDPSDSIKILASPLLLSGPESRRSSTTSTFTDASRRSSWTTFDPPSPQMTMDDLKGVKISYYTSKDRVTYPINRIEYVHDRDLRLRYLVLTPPVSFDSRFHQKISTSERPIPHCEHPEAYSQQDRFRVKFLGQQLVTSQKLSSPQRAFSMTSISSTPVGTSPDSTGSLPCAASPLLTAMVGKVKVESDRLEYDCEQLEDYLAFQERAMGQGYKLRFHEPIRQITFKQIKSFKTLQCEMQYLRLWTCGVRQTVMFYANISSNKYKEYNIEYFRPLDTKSKTELKLKVHWPSLPRRDPSAKSTAITIQDSPSIIGNKPASAPSDEIGVDELRNVDYVVNAFTSAEDKKSFLDKAAFFSVSDEALFPQLELH